MEGKTYYMDFDDDFKNVKKFHILRLNDGKNATFVKNRPGKGHFGRFSAPPMPTPKLSKIGQNGVQNLLYGF